MQSKDISIDKKYRYVFKIYRKPEVGMFNYELEIYESVLRVACPLVTEYFCAFLQIKIRKLRKLPKNDLYESIIIYVTFASLRLFYL